MTHTEPTASVANLEVWRFWIWIKGSETVSNQSLFTTISIYLSYLIAKFMTHTEPTASVANLEVWRYWIYVKNNEDCQTDRFVPSDRLIINNRF